MKVSSHFVCCILFSVDLLSLPPIIIMLCMFTECIDNFVRILILIFTVPTHKELLIELEEVTEWQRLGLLLDLPYPKLKKIEKQNKELEINKMELFDLWLRYAKPPSWETIVCAVRKFNPNLAEKIALRTSHFSKGTCTMHYTFLILMMAYYPGKNSDIEQQLSGESLNQTYHFSSASFPRFQQSSQTFMPPKSVSRPPFLLPTPRVSIVLVIIM